MLVFMKQYGRTMVFVLIAAAVLAIAFQIRINGHTGFIQAAFGKAMEGRSSGGILPLRDVDAVKAAAVRKEPQISFRCTKILPQQAVDLNAMVTAADADGNPVNVEITDIVNEAGESILYQTKEDRKDSAAACSTTGFLFPAAGIYTMDVQAADREQKTAKVQFRIPVTGN